MAAQHMGQRVHATYRIGDAIAVTQRLDDGTWIATFPGFQTTGSAESDALYRLARQLRDTAKEIQRAVIRCPATETIGGAL